MSEHMLMVELTDSVKLVPDPGANNWDTRGVQWYREVEEGALRAIDGDPYDWDPLTDPRGYPFTPVARGTYAVREFLTNDEGTVWSDYIYFVAFNPEEAEPAVVEARQESGAAFALALGLGRLGQCNILIPGGRSAALLLHNNHIS